MKSKYSLPAYVASALLGTVALLAFYESPISPLPVPALPEPPVGRFPPEMPNISPNTQVPFRTNGQYAQDYQRSYQMQMSQNNPASTSVLFPGNAQQRSQPSISTAQSLASSLLSKPQIAQRKSSPDYDSMSSRSFFGSSLTGAAPLKLPEQSLSPKADSKSAGSSFFSFLGFGDLPNDRSKGQISQAIVGPHQASGLTGSELKDVQQKFPGYDYINKALVAFRRYQMYSKHDGQIYSAKKPSFIQSLMKGASFLPGFFAPTRKSTQASPQSFTKQIEVPGGQPQLSERNEKQQQPSIAVVAQQLNAPQTLAKQQPSASSGYGLMRIAHSLIDTLSSASLSQKHSSPGAGTGNGLTNENMARKSSSDNDAFSKTAFANTLINDVLSFTQAAQSADSISQAQKQPQQAQQQSQPSPIDQSQSVAQSPHRQLQHVDQISARSDSPTSSSTLSSTSAFAPSESASDLKKQQSSASSASSDTSHVRKTRSIGLEYPVDHRNNQHQTQSQQNHIDGLQQNGDQRTPSTAAQINNVIDYVAGSYTSNKLLFNLVMNQVGLGKAVPYLEQILANNEQAVH